MSLMDSLSADLSNIQLLPSLPCHVYCSKYQRLTGPPCPRVADTVAKGEALSLKGFEADQARYPEQLALLMPWPLAPPQGAYFTSRLFTRVSASTPHHSLLCQRWVRPSKLHDANGAAHVITSVIPPSACELRSTHC